MSRHELDSGNYAISLGWDRPLQTFFFQLWDKSLDEEEEPVFQLGMSLNECRQLESFIQAVKLNLDSRNISVPVGLNDELIAQLNQDRETEGDGFTEKAPGIQRLVKKLEQTHLPEKGF